jgi:hypothetical protein
MKNVTTIFFVTLFFSACGSDDCPVVDEIECENGTIDIESEMVLTLYRDTSLDAWPMDGVYTITVDNVTDQCTAYGNHIECNSELMSLGYDFWRLDFIVAGVVPTAYAVPVTVEHDLTGTVLHGNFQHNLQDKGDHFRYVATGFFNEFAI